MSFQTSVDFVLCIQASASDILLELYLLGRIDPLATDSSGDTGHSTHNNKWVLFSQGLSCLLVPLFSAWATEVGGHLGAAYMQGSLARAAGMEIMNMASSFMQPFKLKADCFKFCTLEGLKDWTVSKSWGIDLGSKAVGKVSDINIEGNECLKKKKKRKLFKSSPLHHWEIFRANRNIPAFSHTLSQSYIFVLKFWLQIFD